MNNANIQVNEYIKTIEGRIGKFQGEPKEYGLICSYDGFGNIKCFIKDIKSHSFNLIDLIEVEDIVEVTILGEDTEFGATDPIGAIWHIKDESMLRNIKQGCKLGTFELESILTHEQFNNRKYQVNEEEEKEYE